MAEHMKISLLDRRWREQRDRVLQEKKEQEQVFAEGKLKQFPFSGLKSVELGSQGNNDFTVYASWGGGGNPRKNWVGVCDPLPKTHTLFMTKICNTPYPIYDLTLKSKPCF